MHKKSNITVKDQQNHQNVVVDDFSHLGTTQIKKEPLSTGQLGWWCKTEVLNKVTNQGRKFSSQYWGKSVVFT
jgi:hypothetical protein